MMDNLFDSGVATITKLKSKREELKKKATWLMSHLISKRDKEEEQYEFAKEQDHIMNQHGCFNLFTWIPPKDETFMNREEIVEASSPLHGKRKITGE